MHIPSGMRTKLRMWCEPSDGGYIPLISVDRAGAQTGALDQAVRYRKPRVDS
jgi:hypothetical protein